MAQSRTAREQLNNAQEAATEAAQHPWVKNLARIGLAAIGVVYILVGGLAFRLAMGQGTSGNTPDQQTALQQIQTAPLGRLILGLIALGLFGYMLWRLAAAFADADNEGSEPKGLARRIGHALNGLVYGAFGVQAGLLTLGRSSAASGQQEWTARLMSMPFGRWLVGLVGLAVIGVGLYHFYGAWKRKYREDLSYGKMSSVERRWIDPLSVAGLVAQGIVLSLIGIFIINAAYTFNPQEARGLSGALSEIAGQQYGPWLLGIVALGLIAYGIFKLALARYHRVLSR